MKAFAIEVAVGYKIIGIFVKENEALTVLRTINNLLKIDATLVYRDFPINIKITPWDWEKFHEVIKQDRMIITI